MSILWPRFIVLFCMCIVIQSILLTGNEAVTVNQVKRVEKRATKFKDVRQEMENYMRKNVNWGDHLAPAPYTAAILGGLVRLTGNVDFKIASADSTLIRHPESFRATLAQLCHETHTAFSTAHHGMDKIHLSMKMVPSDFYAALKILYRGSIRTMNEKISVPLDQIQRTVQTCKTTAEMVEKQFEDLQCLTQDVLEGCVAEKKDVQEQRQVEELKKKNAEKQRKRYEKRIEKQKALVEKYEKNLIEADKWFKEKMEQFPSGDEMFWADMLAAVLEFFGQDTSNELSDIADGTNAKELKKLDIIEEALSIRGMRTMRESLQILTKKDDQEPMIDKLKKIVEDDCIEGKIRINLSLNMLDDHFWILLNITTSNILKDAQRAEPESELKLLMSKEAADLEGTQYAVVWKEETIKMCKNAIKLIMNLIHLKNQFISNSTSDEQNNEYAQNITSFIEKAKELANGTLRSIVRTNLCELVKKSFKDPGMAEMFQEMIQVSPEVNHLMSLIEYQNGKEILKPISDGRFLKSLATQLEKLRNKAKVVVTSSKNGIRWRGMCLSLVIKGFRLINDLEKSSEVDEEQQTNKIEEIRNLVYTLGEMITIGRQQSNQPSISKKTPQNDGTVRSRSKNVSMGQFALEQAKKKAKEAQANIRRQEKDLLRQRKKKLELAEKLGNIITTLEEANTTELNLKDIIRIIREAIKIFSDLKKQWSKIVEFFQLVSALIGSSKSACQKFSNYTILHQANTKKLLMQELTFKSAHDAIKIVYLVETMSGWYYNVSNQYILPRVSHLATLFAFDPNVPADKQRMNDYVQELMTGTRLAQKDIQSSMMRDQQDFLNTVNGRLRKIFHYYEELIPPVQSRAAADKLEEHGNKVTESLDKDDEEREDDDEEESFGDLEFDSLY